MVLKTFPTRTVIYQTDLFVAGSGVFWGETKIFSTNVVSASSTSSFYEINPDTLSINSNNL